LATIWKPPARVEIIDGQRSVFLAGSIEMGRAEDWQAALTRALSDPDVAILNPRRDEWDASWRQSIDEPRFREQVEWELDGLARADVIAMYFAPDTQSPITLLELGLFAASGKLAVCCPEGFWRRGNVEIVCARQRIPLVADLDVLVRQVRARLAG
jgi:hypothetical protein